MRDVANSAFVFISAGFTLNTCRVLYEDKMVKGVSLWSQVFFTAWTFWSLYFYGALHQWTSVVGESLLSLTMVIYVSMIIYYLRRQKMWKSIRVQCQKCGMVTDALVETTTSEFELYPQCQCTDTFHDQIVSAPTIIGTGNEGTARAGRGKGY